MVDKNLQVIQTIPKEIFRAYDIRGIVDEQLNDDLMYDIGRSIGTEALTHGQDSIVIGRDCRLSGERLSSRLIAGLLCTGINVIDLGIVPTPLLYFGTYFYQTKCGAMLTGSHNPSDYNGVKIMIGGKTISGCEIQKLYTRILEQDYICGTGSYQQNFIIDQYIEDVCSKIILKKKLRIVIDTGNGVAGVMAAKLYRTLGCEVIALFEEPNGNFPNHHPDPCKIENLVDLQAAVIEHHADVGLAFDGDADRLGVVTNKGNVIMPDRQLMLFARSILQVHPNSCIVFDIKCSRDLRHFVEQYQGVACMYKTGHSYIKNKMQETNALLAGEMSGHIFFNERWYGFDDALYAGARLLEILTNDYPDNDLDFLCNDLPNSTNTPEINIPIADHEKFSFVENLKKSLTFADPYQIIDIDGLRVEFDYGWGLIRASNTTPSLVLRFEADSDENLTRIIKDFKHNITAINSTLDFNF